MKRANNNEYKLSYQLFYLGELKIVLGGRAIYLLDTTSHCQPQCFKIESNAT